MSGAPRAQASLALLLHCCATQRPLSSRAHVHTGISGTAQRHMYRCLIWRATWVFFWLGSSTETTADIWSPDGTRYRHPQPENTLESCFNDLSFAYNGRHMLASSCCIEPEAGCPIQRILTRGTFSGLWHTPGSCFLRPVFPDTLLTRNSYANGAASTTLQPVAPSGQMQRTPAAWGESICRNWIRQPCQGRRGRILETPTHEPPSQAQAGQDTTWWVQKA